jgi:AAA domain
VPPGPAADEFVVAEIRRARAKANRAEPDDDDEFGGFTKNDHERKQQHVDTMTLSTLLGMTFAEVKWVVPEILCEGLSLFAGRPKLGKSWMALDCALAVATSAKALGTIECEPGDVLVLALEDSRRRLRSRLQKLGARASERATFAVKWPRIDEGGLDQIRSWLDQHSEARLVIIDTLVKIRPRNVSTKDAYQADTDALAELHQLANERAIAIVVVHHTRKAAAEDWLDSVAGTTGLTGAADSTIVIKRERGQADAFLFGTGRDLPDYELPLKFNEQTCAWSKLAMSYEEARATSEQAGIIAALRSACGAGLLRGQIAAMTGRSKEAISHALRRMEDAGMVEARGNLWHLTVG